MQPKKLNLLKKNVNACTTLAQLNAYKWEEEQNKKSSTNPLTLTLSLASTTASLLTLGYIMLPLELNYYLKFDKDPDSIYTLIKETSTNINITFGWIGAVILVFAIFVIFLHCKNIKYRSRRLEIIRNRELELLSKHNNSNGQ
ncbi:hypothetical protein LG045_00820 [Limosilactobacillus gastricus]|uniref:hypothetical protein n=1 Tax=Limosilactobacillus gastricus TaxID=227942 RepID=UPI000704D3AB|nr:hypothetical protein [Limosilactobacillus gastricus]QGF39783.1 hypothetical protein LG045_00820 [Limosilactobacillus gastricus]